MFIAALFLITKRWKQLNSPSTDEQINKTWYIQTAEHYLVIKRNEVMIYSTTWLNLENVMLNERSQ